MTSRRCRAGRLADRRHPRGEHEGLIQEVTFRVIRKLQADVPGILPNPETNRQPLVFVICAFTPDMEPVFDAISAAAMSVGLRAERIKDLQGDYRITEKMLTLLTTARMVVADLTHERPNVYFELGYARGVGKTVITIIRTGTSAHFDVQDWTYLEYIDSRPLEHQIRQRFAFELATPS